MRSAAAIAIALALCACGRGPGDAPLFPGGHRAAATPPGQEISVPPPPFPDGVFPCSDCHANLDPNPTPRDVTDHPQIALNHGPRDRWCFDCHEPKDRDHLHLAGGKLISFDESYELCGQCHGDKYRDWRVGVHGKRTGSWSGKKQYLLCPSCHNPHSPKFKPLAPLPPPRRPEAIL
jgi:doubled CXXCH motif protein